MNNCKESITFVKKVSEIYHDVNTKEKHVYEYSVYEVSVETGKKFGFTYYNGCTFNVREDGMIFTGDPYPRSYMAGSPPKGGWDSVRVYSTLGDRLRDQVNIDKLTEQDHGKELHRAPFTDANIKQLCALWENKSF